jgi:predicted Zn-dependent protease
MPRFPKAVRLAGGLPFVLLLACSCATVGSGPAGAPPAVPATSIEAELAALGRVPVYDDPRLGGYLAGIVDRLATDQERDGGLPPVAVVVVRDPTIGVFAMPEARVYVHSGLLAAVANEAQLAAILAREVTHLRRGHAATVTADAAGRIAAGLDAIAPSLSAALGRGDEARVVSPVASVILGARLPHAYTGAIAGHGAEREREADAGAFERLVRAGYDPREAPRVFERLRRAALDGGGAERFYVAGEASVAERVAAFTRRPEATSASPRAPIREAADFDVVMIPLVRENARLEMQAGRFRAARAQLDRVIAGDPSDARAHLYEGDLHRLRAQRARSVADRDDLARMALTAYQRCEEVDPSVAEVSRQIGLLYYQQGRLDQARAAFERYLARRPDAPDAARVAEYVLTLTR